jgi:hypothetical protein
MGSSGSGAYGDEVKRQFLAAYPDDFLRDALRLLPTVYRGAHLDCAFSHAGPEAHYLYPHKRRAMLEGQLRELARSYGITASAESNHGGTGYYTLLASGNVRMTANAVDNPSVIPRRAVFRETYARDSQLKLFGEQPPTGTLLYAILLHGPDALNPARPAFAHIVFPNESFTQYVARINLFDRFSDLLSELWNIEEATVFDDLDIQIRPDAERQDDEGEEEAEGQAE